jgi:hypothetical protein
VFGFFETIIEYYTGRDASLMSEDELAIKTAHIMRIRQMESEESLNKQLQALLNVQHR